MPIVNKGVFEVTDLVYERQLGNDWPTVTGFLTSDVTEAPSNLYYTNARVQAYLNSVSIAATGADLSGNTTTDLAEGDNLYYTNSRVLANLAESNIFVKSIRTTEAGTPSISSSSSINLSANASAGGAVVIQNSALRIKSYSTIDRANLTPATGDLIYSTTDTALQVYDGSGWSNVGSLSSLVDFTTDDLAEGSNLYYTNARVNAYVSTLGFITGIDLSGNTTTDLAEGDNLYYTNIRVQSYLDQIGFDSASNIIANIDTGMDLSGNTTTDLAEGDNLYYTNARVLSHLAESDVLVQDLTVQGNLVVQGDTTTLNTATLIVEDKNIVLANGAINAAAANGAGISIDGAQANITYNSTGDKFEINKSVEIQGYSVLTTNNTTTVLAEGNNLYYTNARVEAHIATLGYVTGADISGNTTTDLAEGDNLYYTNIRVQSYLDQIGFDSAANIVANVDVGMNLSGNTTTDLAEGNNLYFTSRRAIDSFTAGKGIIITEAGTISSSDDSDLYNTAIDNSVYDTVTTDGKAIISIGASPSDASYVFHSLQLTNISDNDVYVSGNIQFVSGQNIDLLNRMKMPVGSSLELLDKSLVLLPSDVVNLITFDGNVSVAGTYETVYNDESFINPALTISAADSEELLYDSNLSYTIIETIKVVNLDNTNIPVKIKVADANNSPKGYLIYNLDIPQNSVVDVLQKPKRLENGDKLFVSYTDSANSNAVSIFVSGRLGAVSNAEIYPATIDGTPGNTVIAFSTTDTEGTILYYTFTEV